MSSLIPPLVNLARMCDTKLLIVRHSIPCKAFSTAATCIFRDTQIYSTGASAFRMPLFPGSSQVILPPRVGTFFESSYSSNVPVNGSGTEEVQAVAAISAGPERMPCFAMSETTKQTNRVSARWFASRDVSPPSSFPTQTQ